MAFILVTPYDTFSISNCNKTFFHTSSSTLFPSASFPHLFSSTFLFCEPNQFHQNRKAPPRSKCFQGIVCLCWENFNRFTRSSFVNSPFLRHWKYPYLCFFKHLLIMSFDTFCWSPQSFWMLREEKLPTFSLKLTKLWISDLLSCSVNFLGQPFRNFILSSFNSSSGFTECRYIDVLGVMWVLFQ